MWNRRLTRALPVVLLASFLVAPPALAAPSADAAFPVRVFQIAVDWWVDLTRPMVKVFDLSRAGADPDGTPTTTTTDTRTVEAEHRHGADPDGASTATADGPTVETESRHGADPNG